MKADDIVMIKVIVENCSGEQILIKTMPYDSFVNQIYNLCSLYYLYYEIKLLYNG